MEFLQAANAWPVWFLLVDLRVCSKRTQDPLIGGSHFFIADPVLLWVPHLGRLTSLSDGLQATWYSCIMESLSRRIPLGLTLISQSRSNCRGGFPDAKRSKSHAAKKLPVSHVRREYFSKIPKSEPSWSESQPSKANEVGERLGVECPRRGSVFWVVCETSC